MASEFFVGLSAVDCGDWPVVRDDVIVSCWDCLAPRVLGSKGGVFCLDGSDVWGVCADCIVGCEALFLVGGFWIEDTY